MSSKTHQKNFPTLFLSMYIFQIIYFRQGIINLFPPQRCLIYFRTKHLKIFRKFRKEQARHFEFEILNTILIDFWSSIIIPDFLVQCILRFVTPRFVPSFFGHENLTNRRMHCILFFINFYIIWKPEPWVRNFLPRFLWQIIWWKAKNVKKNRSKIRFK